MSNIFFTKFKDDKKIIRVYFAEFKTQNEVREYVHIDYQKFNDWVKIREHQLIKLGYFEIEFNEIKKTYDAIINATVNTTILQDTVVSETLYYLYKLHYKFNNFTTLNIYNKDGEFLWV
jgi:hypothetical protein